MVQKNLVRWVKIVMAAFLGLTLILLIPPQAAGVTGAYFHLEPSSGSLYTEIGEVWTVAIVLTAYEQVNSVMATVSWKGPVSFYDFSTAGKAWQVAQKLSGDSLELLWEIGPNQKGELQLGKLRFMSTALGSLTLKLSGLRAYNLASWDVVKQSQFSEVYELKQGAPFSDITGNWAKLSILSLVDKQIINGFPDKTFRPNDSLTRAQVAKMIALWRNLPLKNPAFSTFSDLPRDHWAYQYVEGVVASGVINGFPDGTFRPQEAVTKAQLIKLLTVAKHWGIPGFLPNPPSYEDIAGWYQPYIEAAIQQGALNKAGEESPDLVGGQNFYPDLPASRAQACVLLERSGKIADGQTLPELPGADQSLGRIVFASFAGEAGYLSTINADSSGLKKLTDSAYYRSLPKWSPDGTQIAYEAQPDNSTTYSVFVMNADGSGQTRLSNRDASEGSPAWSSDGRQFAFTAYQYGTASYDIWTMNRDGSNRIRLVGLDSYDDYPCWSPDGSKIAFVSNRDGPSEIYVMNANGQYQQSLTGQTADNYWPSWSPDGTKIAFTSSRDGNPEIYLMNADGSNPIRLTNNDAADYYPNWSPDGTQLCFTSERDGKAEIYLMNANGAGQKRLTVTDVQTAYPHWGK
ncbi:MAG: S-layer homology domain-containing protein, partial [Coprothermobacterota bacterium]|nr:S-layer homology domain-containing protein [Coprothermobacterota bacterium]